MPGCSDLCGEKLGRQYEGRSVRSHVHQQVEESESDQDQGNMHGAGLRQQFCSRQDYEAQGHTCEAQDLQLDSAPFVDEQNVDHESEDKEKIEKRSLLDCQILSRQSASYEWSRWPS